jgi:ATP-dependent protease HslVU (ClpYQ) peptidase subunit
MSLTTVAYKDGVIAADSMSVIDKMKWSLRCKKVWKLPNGDVIGFAGPVMHFRKSVDLLNASIRAAKNKNSIDLPDLHKSLFALLASKTHIYMWTGKDWSMDKPEAYAYGPGEKYAQGAMDAGADAVTAIKVAIKRDLYTGGRVQFVEVG